MFWAFHIKINRSFIPKKTSSSQIKCITHITALGRGYVSISMPKIGHLAHSSSSTLTCNLLLMLSPLPLLYLSSFMAFTSSVLSSANVSAYEQVIWEKLMAGFFDVYTEVIYFQHKCTQLWCSHSEMFLFKYFVQIKDDLIKEMLTRMPQLTAINFYHEDFRTETMVNYWFIQSAAKSSHMTDS